MFIFDRIFELVEIIYEYAEKELYDEATIRKKLMELHLLYELRDIDEIEYEALEEKLLEQLRTARKYNMEKSKELDDESDENDEGDEDYEDDDDYEDYEDDNDENDESS